MAPGRNKNKQKQAFDLDAFLIPTWVLHTGILALVALVLAVGAIVYYGPTRSPEAKAASAIKEAHDLMSRAANSPNLYESDKLYKDGSSLLEMAEEELANGDFVGARDDATEAQGLFRGIINQEDEPADGSFEDVEGDVQTQRPGAAYERARRKMPLNHGDWVKTGASGSTRILYKNRDLHTIRPNSLVEFQRRLDPITQQEANRVVMKSESGGLDISTGGSGSTEIRTPRDGTIIAGPNTRGLVEIDPDKNDTKIAVYSGEAKITSVDGSERTLGPREVVVEDAKGSLSPVLPLPPTPKLTSPRHNAKYDMSGATTVALAWEPVAGSDFYHLQISRNRFFTNPEIEVPERRKTSAKIKILADGAYFWRVASVNAASDQTPRLRSDWSKTHRFRFTSEEAQSDHQLQGDPPMLKLVGQQFLGRTLVLTGKTDPGAFVQIDGVGTQVGPDGSWSQVHDIQQVGRNQIMIVATKNGIQATLKHEFSYNE